MTVCLQNLYFYVDNFNLGWRGRFLLLIRFYVVGINAVAEQFFENNKQSTQVSLLAHSFGLLFWWVQSVVPQPCGLWAPRILSFLAEPLLNGRAPLLSQLFLLWEGLLDLMCKFGGNLISEFRSLFWHGELSITALAQQIKLFIMLS